MNEDKAFDISTLDRTALLDRTNKQLNKMLENLNKPITLKSILTSILYDASFSARHGFTYCDIDLGDKLRSELVNVTPFVNNPVTHLDSKGSKALGAFKKVLTKALEERNISCDPGNDNLDMHLHISWHDDMSVRPPKLKVEEKIVGRTRKKVFK